MVERGGLLLEKIMKVVTSTMLVAMVVLVLMQVLFRYLLNFSLAWTEEISRYLFVWISLLGAGLAFNRGEHSGYESLVNALPKRLGMLLLVLGDLGVGALVAVMGLGSIELIKFGRFQFTPALMWPMSYIYWVFPVSAAVFLAYVGISIKHRLQSMFGGRAAVRGVEAN